MGRDNIAAKWTIRSHAAVKNSRDLTAGPGTREAPWPFALSPSGGLEDARLDVILAFADEDLACG